MDFGHGEVAEHEPYAPAEVQLHPVDDPVGVAAFPKRDRRRFRSPNMITFRDRRSQIGRGHWPDS
jgi:hypothetical protein